MAKHQRGELNVMEWISISNRLPGKGERILFYTPFAIFGEDHSCIGDSDSINTCKTEIEGELVPIFTHWMPLPKAPQAQR